MSSPKVSYAQNGEDIRVWRAFGGHDSPQGLIYADIGAHDPWELSITASLYELGWRGVLVEADPEFAKNLRSARPGDTVVEVAAAAEAGFITFHRVPETGLGTTSGSDADVARDRGFAVEEVTVPAQPLDQLLTQEPHFMSIDVEGAEAEVLKGLSLTAFRPWVLCIEAVAPGTQTPNHHEWEPHLVSHDYSFVTFDGVNRWYVANERNTDGVLAERIATPFSAVDRGIAGWQSITEVRANLESQRIERTHAWQRELERSNAAHTVPLREYEKQIHELRSTLNAVEASKTFQLSQKVSKIGKKFVGKSRAAAARMPAPISRFITQRRHIKHATINMGHLTPPEFLVDTPSIRYIPQFSDTEFAAAEEYIAGSLRDTDADLEARMDGHGDLLGRTRAATRTRMALFTAEHTEVTGNAILFDARSLQVNHFRNRGIGRFASAALIAAAEYADSSGVDLVLLVDHGLPTLAPELAGDRELIQRVTAKNVARFGNLIQPSPLTHSPRPLIPVLASNAAKLAIVFDFIPLHFPEIYLPTEADKVEYEAGIDALRQYTDFTAISHLTKKELDAVLGRDSQADVCWPGELFTRLSESLSGNKSGPIVVMTGDDPRKNTFGALAAIGAATTDHTQRDVVVLGMAGQQERVHHWSIAAIMRPGEVTALGHVTDEEMGKLLADSQLVVVDSFDEGLSLPVLEAIQCGAKVVASDISAHRELLGNGSHLINPRVPRSASRSIKKALKRKSQQLRIQHEYGRLESSVRDFLARNAREDNYVDLESSPSSAIESRISVALATPWPPQKSGVADYSAAIAGELGKLVDLTIFSTGDSHRNVDELLANPDSDEFDVIISVVGNSHYHLPYIELTTVRDCMVISHDARLNEFYLALRGPGGLRNLMESSGCKLQVDLNDQIDDMRLLEDAAFWEVAHRARPLIFHTPVSATLVGKQTNTEPFNIAFANYRGPSEKSVTEDMRRDAKRRLGFTEGVLHVSSFGYIDDRTKLSSEILESVAWLKAWGYAVSLHFVGSAGEEIERSLYERAGQLGITDFQITGYISDETYRDHLLATDIAVQLRISPYLGVSGALSDFSAYGTTALASESLVRDAKAPEFIEPLPNAISTVDLAEAIRDAVYALHSHVDIELQRRAFIQTHSPRAYSSDLLSLVLTQGAIK